MKKIINMPDMVVAEMLNGMAKAVPFLKFDKDNNVIFREKSECIVGIVSGGGAGHEPAHAGYIGEGMLTSVASGNVFASPGPDGILSAIRHADAGEGVLLVIKNYSGDIMNFSMAGELAAMEDIRIDSVIVKDDVAVPDSTYSTGRRGIAGTIFVHKVAGAKAAKGASLAEVKSTAQKCIDNLRSMGMAMTPCVLPGVGKPGFELDDDEIEIGMGIHGEPGVSRSDVLTAEKLAKALLDHIFADKDFDGYEVAVMVNGLGGTPLMELYILYNEVEKVLKQHNIKPERVFVGNYMTSLEMAGASVTLLQLDDELKELIDAPSTATAFRR